MLNESMPTASASTASSTVLRMTTSPLSSRPDASTLIGTNESNPNSTSWALLILRFLPADRSPVPRLGSLIPFAITKTSGGQVIAYASTSEAGGTPYRHIQTAPANVGRCPVAIVKGVGRDGR